MHNLGTTSAYPQSGTLHTPRGDRWKRFLGESHRTGRGRRCGEHVLLHEDGEGAGAGGVQVGGGKEVVDRRYRKGRKGISLQQ
jgi:hypothetical protein